MSASAPTPDADLALDVPVTIETAEQLGLLPEEFNAIQRILGRIPNFNELSVYSVMSPEAKVAPWMPSLPVREPTM
jgi:phosphoribosylformylglycinamidine synthase